MFTNPSEINRFSLVKGWLFTQLLPLNCKILGPELCFYDRPWVSPTGTAGRQFTVNFSYCLFVPPAAGGAQLKVSDLPHSISFSNPGNRVQVFSTVWIGIVI